MTTTRQRGALTNVLYVERQDAKTIKVLLERKGLLNRDFRMTGIDTETLELDDDEKAQVVQSSSNKFIAVPVLMENYLKEQEDDELKKLVVSTGRQYCPYSTAVLGNQLRSPPSQSDNSLATEKQGRTLTRIQEALLETLFSGHTENKSKEEIVEAIAKLNPSTCPKKLEVLGDDRTLIIPRRALSLQNDEFLSLVQKNRANDDPSRFLTELWKRLAHLYGNPRVARRGDVDPESPIRESGHVLLWPPQLLVDSGDGGPDSPGWITVTEQGIRQSFDLTRVMFSRGNITEKIRFGKLVKDNETVLDLYAGIGYYALPALIHGKARHVVACEWNPHAALALDYNLQQNRVQGKATVLVGDCRRLAVEHGLVNRFDRISLGLLPSSEGGWRTALRALRRDVGGWLHVHGNVPDVELNVWRQWLCISLSSLVREESISENDGWIVLCTHVERVKSFGPKIHHYVADVWVGPPPKQFSSSIQTTDKTGVILQDGSFVPCPNEVEPPSCALSSSGVLHQSWMMDIG